MKKIILLIVGVLFTATLFAEGEPSIRLGMGPAKGNYTFSDSTGSVPSGALDRDLSGIAFSASYISTVKWKWIWGGGWENKNLSGSSDGNTAGTTKIKIEEYNSTFIFGFLGYHIGESNIYFQPNLRLGWTAVSAKFKQSSTVNGTSNTHAASGSGVGYAIDLPIMIQMSNNVGLGANIYYSPVEFETKTADSTQTHTFESSNQVNLLVDILF